MVHDLFSLKVKLNARRLTTEMGTHTFTVRADRAPGETHAQPSRPTTRA